MKWIIEISYHGSTEAVDQMYSVKKIFLEIS